MTYEESKSKSAASARRKEKRAERVVENAALKGSKQAPGAPPLLGQVSDRPGIAKSRKSKPRRKKSPRKTLVRKADIAFSLYIRALYPVSFFSGKPTECCFHIVSRSKHSVRWSLDNAVGATMGENYEMEFNPHKFITILIEKRGLPWYEALVRRSNEIRKHSRADLEMIEAMGHDGGLAR